MRTTPLKKLEWPANSPDLNPTDNVWKAKKDVVQKKKNTDSK